MSNRVCVIDMPGLSQPLLSAAPAETALGKWLAGKSIRGLAPSFPGVTCSMQATLTTGAGPSKHGIVANGLATFRFPADQALVDASNFADYRRNISFWEQSNQFLGAPRFWQDASGKSRWKTALLFFQNCMPGFSGAPRPAADIVLTPKPDHGPDGKLTSLCWSSPPELVGQLFKELGPFPLMNYWGPMAGIASSQWIAKASAKIWHEHAPHLQWVYIPHLDYDLQRFGPSSPQAKKAVADAAAAIDPLVETVLRDGGRIILLSEYEMHDVSQFVQPNLLLAEAGLLKTVSTPDGELVDYANSVAFAMVDHQIAHVYVNQLERLEEVKQALRVPGVGKISARAESAVNHPRAGDLVLEAEAASWFDYRWWPQAGQAPNFAKMVDIHRKPGYDPLELFWDRAANGVSQNPALIKGSHGLTAETRGVIAGDGWRSSENIAAADVAREIAAMLEG